MRFNNYHSWCAPVRWQNCNIALIVSHEIHVLCGKDTSNCRFNSFSFIPITNIKSNRRNNKKFYFSRSKLSENKVMPDTIEVERAVKEEKTKIYLQLISSIISTYRSWNSTYKMNGKILSILNNKRYFSSYKLPSTKMFCAYCTLTW